METCTILKVSETLRAWALNEIMKAYTYIQEGIKSKRSIAASKIKFFKTASNRIEKWYHSR